MKKLLGGIILGLLFGFSLSLIFAWTNPSGNPPSGGGVLQTQNTGLFINTSTYFISNVGIGTTNPNPWARLDVAGNARISGDIDISGSNRWTIHSPDDGRTTLYIAPWGGTDWNWGAQTRFDNNGNVYFSGTVGISGKVGIGTTAPGRKLHIVDNVDVNVESLLITNTLNRASLRLVGNSTGDSGAASANVQFYDSAGTDNAHLVFESAKSGDPLAVWINSIRRLGIYGGTSGLSVGSYSGTVPPADGMIIPGNVGIGTTEPIGRLGVVGGLIYAGDTNTRFGAQMSGDDAGRGVFGSNMYVAGDNTIRTFGTHASYGYSGVSFEWGNIKFYSQGGATVQDAIVSPSTRMIINTDGNVGIGTTNPGGYKLYVNGSVYASSYQCASDIRLKKEIKELNGTLEKVMNLHPISFIWNEKSENSGKKDIGIAGQEIEKYFPELVFKNNGYISVDYSKLSVVAISAIREQQKIIEEQAQKIKVLEEKVKGLEEILRKNEK